MTTEGVAYEPDDQMTSTDEMNRIFANEGNQAAFGRAGNQNDQASTWMDAAAGESGMAWRRGNRAGRNNVAIASASVASGDMN